MKGKQRRTVDILMTAVLLFLMGYQFWGEKAHEWAGTGIFILFLAHHILNFGWYKNLLKGNYPPFRIFQIGINVLALISMLVLSFMGACIFVSHYLGKFLCLLTQKRTNKIKSKVLKMDENS